MSIDEAVQVIETTPVAETTSSMPMDKPMFEPPTDPQPQEAPGMREGSDAIAEAMVASGIEIVFGYTGGAVPSLTRAMPTHGIPMFSARSEISAAWMSAGYNRVKRRAASVLITHHVGAIHAAPAVYSSTMDGTPLFHISLDNPPALEARDGLQDALAVAPVLKAVSKYHKKVSDAGDLPVIVRQAIKEASTGRHGASSLVIAQTVMYQKTGLKVEPLVLAKPPSPHADDVAATWELLKNAEHPMLYVGAGVHISDASAELREFAELTGIPIVSSSWGGRGLLPDSHEAYQGPSGNFGWRSANKALQSADVWLALGVSFSQMSTASWSLTKPDTVVHVDVDQYQLGKIFQPTIGIQSDAKYFLQALTALAKRDAAADGLDRRDAWRAELATEKSDWLIEMTKWYEPDELPINQYWLLKTLSDNLPDDTLIIGDSGGNAFALYRAFMYKTVTPNATGGHYMSMGQGLPVAIGAKLAAPERTVISYHGDGGFYYDMAELTTLRERGIKVIVIIDNNHCLLANRASMKAIGIDNPWVDLPETTDFIQVAKGLGVDGETVQSPDDVIPALQRALAAEESYVLDIHTTSGLRIRRAFDGVIPIVGDRTPKNGHLETVLEGSWPS